MGGSLALKSLNFPYLTQGLSLVPKMTLPPIMLVISVNMSFSLVSFDMCRQNAPGYLSPKRNKNIGYPFGAASPIVYEFVTFLIMF